MRLLVGITVIMITETTVTIITMEIMEIMGIMIIMAEIVLKIVFCIKKGYVFVVKMVFG